jgi:hypothetical protein
MLLSREVARFIRYLIGNDSPSFCLLFTKSVKYLLVIFLLAN